MKKNLPTPAERIEHSILAIREHRVLLDADLAELYGVSTSSLNQAVKRNAERFPEDFMFRLTPNEVLALRRSQTVIASHKYRNIKHLPYAFTQEGVAMLSSVLRSARAVQVNIEIMRAFVRLRWMLASNDEPRRRIRRTREELKAARCPVPGCFSGHTPAYGR